MRAPFKVVCLAPAFAWVSCAPATEAPGPLYRLPYLEGQAYAVTQAPGGFITSHTSPDSRYAVDFRMPEATPVAAARAGVVSAVEWRHEAAARGLGAGNLVRVRHEDGTVATYAHLMHYGVAVEQGEIIEAGRIVGYSGATGDASAPHLHFDVTRIEGAGEAARQVSVPVRFYNGHPPEAFALRVGMAVAASYTMPAPQLAEPRAAAPPADARALPRLVRDRLPEPTPEVLAAGFVRLAAWLVLGLAGLAWFWRFARS